MNRMLRSFGRRVCTDIRDDKFPIRQMATNRISRYWHQSCWWGNQKDTPACVGHAWCMPPEYRTLTRDLRWVSLGDLSVGDEIVAFDEHTTHFGRYYRPSFVEGVRIVPAKVLAVELDDGRILHATPDHGWIVKRHMQWRTTDQLRYGKNMRSTLPQLFEPWSTATDWESGWLGGFLDGEGSIGRYAHVVFGQRPGRTLDRALDIVARRGYCFATGHIPNKHHGLGRGDAIKVNINGGARSAMRLLGTIRPIRLIDNLDVDSIGRMDHRSGDPCPAVVDVRDAGVMEVAQVQTTTGTMIVEGFPVHNCHWIEDGPITHAGRKPMIDPFKIYDDAKKVDEFDGTDYDGTSVRAGAKVLKSLNLIKSYRWTTKVMTLANAILTQGPCVLGTWWYSGMMDTDASGFIAPTGQILGGHAYLLNGVNMKSGKFRIKQSWGRDWGKAGNAFLTFESLEKLLSQDGEACLAIEMTDKERLSAPQTRSR